MQKNTIFSELSHWNSDKLGAANNGPIKKTYYGLNVREKKVSY